ncbi:MAG: YdcF family protein [Anaeromassilibacillus sp.]
MKRTHKEKITSVSPSAGQDCSCGLHPAFWGVFHVGNGGEFCSASSDSGGIWYVPLRSRMEQAKHAKPLRVLRRSCWGILAVCFAWAAFLTGCMLWPTPSPSGSGTVVILGCKVGSAALQARIDAAAEYLHSHPDAVAIASGGQGDGEWISEAEAIRSGLEQHGISSGRIYLEHQITNTNENAANSRRVIERRRALTQPVSW